MAYSQALEEQVALRDRTSRSEWMRLPEWADAAQATVDLLDAADPYFWGGSMCGVIRGACQDLPPSWKWSPEMLPTPAGFIWFEKPWGLDSREFNVDPVAISALGWMKFRDSDTDQLSLVVVPFTRDAHAEHSRIHPFIVLAMRVNETMYDVLERVKQSQNTRTLIVSGQALMTLGACLIFLQQRILIAPKHRADRPARRRLEREGYQHEPLIRVVELRRKQSRSNRGDDHEAVEWSCQWIVSGHWRNQWYASLNDYQPRWIMPYVKGDPTKLLKPPRARVFAVTR